MFCNTDTTNTKKLERTAWIAVLFMAVGEFVANYAQYQLSPVSGRFMEQYRLTAAQFSSIYSAPMIPSFILGLFAGPLCDKIGAKKVIGGGMIITAIGTILRLFAQNYALVYISMLLIGFSIACLNVCVGKAVGSYFSNAKAGAMVGIVFAGSSVGMLVGTSTTAFFTELQTALIVAACGAVIITIVWFILVKEFPVTAVPEEEKNAKENKPLYGLKLALRSKIVWLGGGIACTLLGSNLVIGGFLPQALQSRGMTEAEGGLFCSAMTLGCVIGTIFGGRLTKWIRKKVLLIIASALICVGGAIGWMLPPVLIAIAMLLVGISLGMMFSLVMSMPVCDKTLGVRYSGSGNGIITMIEMLGAVIISTYIISPIAGSNYYLLFALGGVSALIGLVCACLLPKDVG